MKSLPYQHIQGFGGIYKFFHCYTQTVKKESGWWLHKNETTKYYWFVCFKMAHFMLLKPQNRGKNAYQKNTYKTTIYFITNQQYYIAHVQMFYSRHMYIYIFTWEEKQERKGMLNERLLKIHLWMKITIFTKSPGTI